MTVNCCNSITGTATANPGYPMKKTLFAMAFASLPCLLACADDLNTQDTTNGVPNQMPPMAMTDYGHPLSAGLMIGEPTGPTVKYFINDTIAVDAAAGWSLFPHSDAEIQADVLWHNYQMLHVDEGRLPVYFGVGLMGRFRHNRDDEAGIRVPFGISYMFDNIPVNLFAEIGPAIIFTPDWKGEIVGGIGARYRF